MLPFVSMTTTATNQQIPPHEGLPPIGLLAELPTDTLKALSAIGSVNNAPIGKKLATQGVDHEVVSIVLSGRLRVSCHAHGDQLELAILEPGDIVGEMSLLDPKPSSADVEVIHGPARIWSVRNRDLTAFLESDPVRGYAVLKVLAKGLCQRLRASSEHRLRQADLLRSHFLDIDY